MKVPRVNQGFTLIEFLIAFGVLALVLIPLISLLNQSLRLVRVTDDLTAVTQALPAPNLGEKALGVRTRVIGAEDIEIGPLRVRGVDLELTPATRTDGIRVRMYDRS